MGSSRSQMCSTAALREVVCRNWGGSLADEVSPAGDDNYYCSLECSGVCSTFGTVTVNYAQRQC